MKPKLDTLKQKFPSVGYSALQNMLVANEGSLGNTIQVLVHSLLLTCNVTTLALPEQVFESWHPLASWYCLVCLPAGVNTTSGQNVKVFLCSVKTRESELLVVCVCTSRGSGLYVICI